MILVGTTGGRCTACSAATRRRSPATRSPPSRRTCTTAPSSRILRNSTMRPASRWPVEPEVDLSGAHRVLIVAERTRRGGYCPLPQRGHPYQVMREPRLGVHLQEFWHRGDHLGVVPGLEPCDPLQVRRARLGGPDVHGVAGLVRA